MKIICKETTSKKIDLNEVKTVFSNNYDYNFGGYGIELGVQYTVMGVVWYKNSNYPYYLIDTFGKPNWFPNQLFDVVDNSIPKNWFMSIYNKSDIGDIYGLFGFEELCNNEDFYDQLIERDEEAVRIYFRRKIEMEKEFSEGEQ